MMEEFNTDAIDAARLRVTAQVTQAQVRKEAIDRLAAAVHDAKATAKSSRGEVTVTASPSGRIESVTFADSSSNLSASALSALVTTTIAEAQHAAAMAAVQLSSESLGADSPLLLQIRQEAEIAFPGPATDQISYK